MKKPTLRSIASEAGVSHNTVSLALRNSPRVSKALRLRIQEIADRVGYRTDLSLSRTMREVKLGGGDPIKGTVLGILPQSYSTIPQNWRTCIDAVQHRLEQLSFALELRRIAPGGLTEEQALAKKAHATNCAGICLFEFSSEVYDFLDVDIWNTVYKGALPPAVSVWNIINSERGWPSVTVAPDAFVAGQLAASKLLMLGYQRPLLVTESFGLRMAAIERFEAGFLSECAKAKDARLLDKPWPQTARLQDDVLAKAQACGADCVVNPPPSLMEMVDQDLPFPNLGFCAWSTRPETPGFSGINLQSEHVGRTAADCLVAQIHRDILSLPEAPSAVAIRPAWHDAQSCPQLPSALQLTDHPAPGKGSQSPLRWETFDLSHLCNYRAVDLVTRGGAGNLHQNLPAGRVYFREIPFEIPGGQTRQRVLVALETEQDPASASPGATTSRITLPLGNKPLKALHVLLGALFVERPGEVARLALAGDNCAEPVAEKALIALGENPSRELRKKASIQDWWAGYEVCRRGGESSPVIIGSSNNLESSRIFYAVTWELPDDVRQARPDALEVRISPATSATLCLLGITAEYASSSS